MTGTGKADPRGTAYADEESLLAGLRSGDGTAFEQLVRDQGARMLAVARRILRSEEDARDAVQEAFLSAFRAIDRFEGDALLSTWLHRIVVNAALMRLRTRRRKPEQPIDDLLPGFLENGHAARPARPWAHTPDDPALVRERLGLVRKSIEQLPESYRTVLLLRDIEELDTEETATAMGISPNAVKTRLHRARQALRTLLEPHFAEDGS